MKNIAFIPARGGSKGVARKNIRLLNGKPLIAWSIEQAKNSMLIDEVYVSTDDPEIKKIAEEYGAIVPFLRPAELSSDTASTESAVMHFIEWADVEKVVINNIILVQATSPLRYSRQFDEAITLFLEKEADSLVSVSRIHGFFWTNFSNPKPTYDIFNRPRRQDIEPDQHTYIENGSFYISKVDIYRKYQNRLAGKIIMYEMSREEAFEIDHEIDFKINDLLMKEYGF